MAQRRQRRSRGGELPSITVLNPGKGLNNFSSDSLIKDDESSAEFNMRSVESGAVAKAVGFAQLGNTLSNNPRGLASFKTTSIAYVLTVDGTALKYLNVATWTSISGATFSSSADINFCQAGGDLYIYDGVSSAAKLTTALTLTRPTTTPSGAFGIFFSDRHIISGSTAKPSRLFISGTTTLDDFTNAAGELSTSAGVPGASAFAGTDANYIDVAKDDGDVITALAKFQSVLIIFKQRSIYSLEFDSSGNPVITRVNNSIGAVSHKSVDSVENDVFFLSRRGYYVLGNEPNYFNVIRTNELSNRVHPILETVTSGNLDNTCSIYSDYVFYTSLSTGGTTTNNQTLTYDRRFLSWHPWNHVKAETFTEHIDASNNKHLYYTSADSAKVYEIDQTSYSSAGSAISASFTSKAFDLGDFSRYKRWVYIDLFFRQISGTVTITLIADDNTVVKSGTVSSSSDPYGTIGATFMLGDYPMGGGVNPNATTSSTTSTTNVPYRIKLNKVSRSLKIKVENANNNETFTLLGWTLVYRPYNRNKFPSTLKIQ